MAEELFKSVILHLSYIGGLAETVNTLIHRVRLFTVFTGPNCHLFHIHSNNWDMNIFTVPQALFVSQTENSETLDLPGIGKISQRADQSTFKRLCTQHKKKVNIRLFTKSNRYRNPIVLVVQVCIVFKSRLLKDLLVTISFPGKCC
jgi:hypothetical protein